MLFNKYLAQFPEDFRKCAEFHGHICPGLAIGYAVSKIAQSELNLGSSQDEEIVAFVENDSCAVDAVQALLGCTFGKGNFIFRDWGKQVFTFYDRNSSRGVRISFLGPMPHSDERRALRQLIAAGEASDEDRKRFEEISMDSVRQIVSGPPDKLFTVKEVEMETPPKASIVATEPCGLCGELTMSSRMFERDGKLICRGCAISPDLP
jgi:formylmethanofuran dehydrogenase subunit E